jgi:8-oxo-dGTP diphosphatase
VRQAQRLVPLLSAYGIRRIVSSDAARCVDTVLPYINSTFVKLKLDPSISEEGVNKKRLARRIDRSLKSTSRLALCSHRPVLPLIFAELNIEPVLLEPGEIIVVHRSDGKVVGVETLEKPGT